MIYWFGYVQLVLMLQLSKRQTEGAWTGTERIKKSV